MITARAVNFTLFFLYITGRWFGKGKNMQNLIVEMTVGMDSIRAGAYCFSFPNFCILVAVRKGVVRI